MVADRINSEDSFFVAQNDRLGGKRRFLTKTLKCGRKLPYFVNIDAFCFVSEV